MPQDLIPSLASTLLLAALGSVALAEDSSVTVHNGGFAVVRETIDLELGRGVNELSFTEVTAHLEPDSVILRDASGRRTVQVLEQNYRNDPVSQQLLLSLYEGRTLDFLVGTDKDGQPRTVQGRVIRSGYVPHRNAWNR
ncbi:MAG: hypothetical protein AAGA81_19055, partial [Acidobacteriota bacterium]